MTDREATLPQRWSPSGGAEGGRGPDLLDRSGDSWGADPRVDGESAWLRLAGP